MAKRGRPVIRLLAICGDTGIAIYFASGKEAASFGFSAKQISRILHHRGHRTHKGWLWYMADGRVDPFEGADDPRQKSWWINSQKAFGHDPGVLDQEYADLPAGGLPTESQEGT